ncbi:MAG: hypothetical protein OXT65_06355 [Alphaproteobacteria bacterium]|nr:hypothetical protein [Alphaproteobacteria bacterium]
MSGFKAQFEKITGNPKTYYLATAASLALTAAGGLYVAKNKQNALDNAVCVIANCSPEEEARAGKNVAIGIGLLAVETLLVAGLLSEAKYLKQKRPRPSRTKLQHKNITAPVRTPNRNRWKKGHRRPAF